MECDRSMRLRKVYPQCNTVVHVNRSVCDCGHAFTSKKRKARCTAVGELAGIPLLAHSLTVKLSPCPCSHNSPAGRIAACLWAFQMQFATHSGSPQDDSASFYTVSIILAPRVLHFSAVHH